MECGTMGIFMANLAGNLPFLYFSQKNFVCPFIPQYVHMFLSLRNLNLSCMGTLGFVHSYVKCEP